MDAMRWQSNTLALLDQRELPAQEVWLECAYYRQVAQAISDRVVQGTSSVAIAAAYGYCLAAAELAELPDFARRMAKAREELEGTRPCRGLRRALTRMEDCLNQYLQSSDLFLALNAQAVTIHRQEVIANRTIGRVGAELLPSGANVLTLGSTGSLATGGVGTALAVIRSAARAGKLSMVYVAETRPRLEGARLTAWELAQEQLPVTVIHDSAAAPLMSQQRVNLVLAGCMGMAANGDFIGVSGSYSIALTAYFHSIPFFVAIPTPGIDLSVPQGDALPMGGTAGVSGESEECPDAYPAGAALWMPQRDIVPSQLVTGVITEKGMVFPPYGETLAELLS